MSVSSTKLIEGLAFQIESSGFLVQSDVSEKLGGQNTAPNPHDYIEIALAACTTITVQMYAKRKNIPLDYSDVSAKITAEGVSNEILREIKFIGEKLTDQDREALLKIADKCPIHKLLSAGAKITTNLI